MNDKIDPIQHLIDALNFYAKPDNYWSDPLSLDKFYCLRTLRDVRDSEKTNKILVDKGKIALQALDKFDQYLKDQYELNKI